MSKITGTILCGKCKVEIAGPDGELSNDSLCRCPECGQEERYDNIIEEVQAYFTDTVKAAMDKKMDDMARSSKFITVTEHFSPLQREYRFVTDKLPEV